MTEVKTRKRKPVSAAQIELDLWFVDSQTYQQFAAVPLGRMSTSVSEREWVSAVYEPGYPELGIEAVYRFTHTCRNEGAQRPDSERFFKSTCNAAGIPIDGPVDRPAPNARAVLIEVRLLDRTTVEA